jgi:oxygen-independent coproporphyrinogen-3 oxidase
MELPFNTVYSKDILGNQIETPVADWPTKRRWVDYAYDQFINAGYAVSSAYTLVRHPERVNFSYRDNLWRGSDLLATGIASFGHISGVHYQNLAEWEQYCGSLEEGKLPLNRALRISPRQALIREMILQLKKGYLDGAYFQGKFGVDIFNEWRGVWDEYADEGYAVLGENRVELTRAGLLRVDGLLPAFFEPEFRDVRYT